MRGDPDLSNGWEAVVASFLAVRSDIGAGTVREWAATFPKGAAIVDLGCGSGVPVSQVLIEAGLDVYGIDASPGMVAAFREGFPGVPVECEAVERSTFFDRSFDGAVAWGLMFLLPVEVQQAVIHRVAGALHPGGRFLFTAPGQACSWVDASTGRMSQSAGSTAYTRMLAEAGLALTDEREDEGENHYYEAVRI